MFTSSNIDESIARKIQREEIVEPGTDFAVIVFNGFKDRSGGRGKPECWEIRGFEWNEKDLAPKGNRLNPEDESTRKGSLTSEVASGGHKRVDLYDYKYDQVVVFTKKADKWKVHDIEDIWG